MSEGFSNPIVGGAENLIRSAIRSPNYIPNTTGWRIAKDGSVDLNDAIIRGILTILGIDNSTIILNSPSGNPTINLRPSDIAGHPGYNAALQAAFIKAVSNSGGSQNGDTASLAVNAPSISTDTVRMFLQSASFDGTVTPEVIFNTLLGGAFDFIVSNNGGLFHVGGEGQFDQNLTILGQSVFANVNNGQVDLVRPPFLKLVQHVQQTLVSSAVTNIIFNDTNGDVEAAIGSTGWYASGINFTGVVPDVPGYYEVTAHLGMAAATYSQLSAGVAVNGTRVDPQCVTRPSGSAASTAQTTAIVHCDGVADTISSACGQVSGANQNTNVNAGLRSTLTVKLHAAD